MSLPIRQTYDLARGAGLGHSSAVTATAIAMAESSLNPSAVGDVSLQDGKWGPSIGLWQIRSLKAQKGTGKARDADRLTDPTFNAHAMAQISTGGANFAPWSTYKSGAYRSHLADVRAGIGAGSASAGSWSSSSTATPAGYTSPGDLLGGAITGGAAVAGGAAAGVTGALASQLAPAMLIGLGILGGFTLIAIGAWRGVSD